MLITIYLESIKYKLFKSNLEKKIISFNDN